VVTIPGCSFAFSKARRCKRRFPVGIGHESDIGEAAVDVVAANERDSDGIGAPSDAYLDELLDGHADEAGIGHVGTGWAVGPPGRRASQPTPA
jgi:hypothetical protein